MSNFEKELMESEMMNKIHTSPLAGPNKIRLNLTDESTKR